MRVRALDQNHDFLFGKGTSDYLVDLAATVQNINTRLLSVVGDCFFDLTAGVDWFNFIGSKQQQALNLAIATVILNTPFVTGIQQLSSTIGSQGNFSVSYKAQTGFGLASSTFIYDTQNLG